MSIKHLKVKIKTLANEAQDIRAEEEKLKVDLTKEWGLQNMLERATLHRHRVVPLRKAARNNFLAYGFLRGRRYSQIEQASYREPEYEEIIKLIIRFNSEPIPQTTLRQRFAEWYEEVAAVRNRSFERQCRRNEERYLRQRARLEEIRSMTQEQINEYRATRKLLYTGGSNA